MTTSDILKRYLEYNHLKVASGNAESFEPLLPFVLMDTVYQLWCKRVQPIPCRFQQNHYKKELSKFIARNARVHCDRVEIVGEYVKVSYSVKVITL